MTALLARCRPVLAESAQVESDATDGGRAMIEVIFLAVLLLIPTVYILASVMRIQAATFAVTQGARDAARVMDSAPTVAVGVARAEEIAQLAVTDQNCRPKDSTCGSLRPAATACPAPRYRRACNPVRSTTSASSRSWRSLVCHRW